VDLWGLCAGDVKEVYYDNYNNPSYDSHVINGKNVGQPDMPTINIVVTYSTETNTNGAIKGSLTVYHANDKEADLGLLGTSIVTVPIVSGGNENQPASKGIYKELIQEKTSTSGNEILKNLAHGGPDNIMIRLPNSGGNAIHMGNAGANQDSAWTEGCVAVTSEVESNGEQSSNTKNNYDSFKKAINPYGYEGLKINAVIIK
jgi:hypothetical protein